MNKTVLLFILYFKSAVMTSAFHRAKRNRIGWWAEVNALQDSTIFLIPGRDQRSRYCAEALAKKGLVVENCPIPQADVIVLPMRTQIPPELLEQLRPGQYVLGGCLGAQLKTLASHGVTALDYYDDPLLPWANAVPTAEGAIGILLGRLPGTVQGSRGLITGCGRIGKVLAQKLALLGAEITVSARKDADLGAILAAGLRAERTGDYRIGLDRYDYFVNTVPASVLKPEHYLQIRRDCLLLELASDPGGFDERACREAGLSLIRAPGLPGKYAPKTAGYAIADAVIRILNLEPTS